MARKRAEHGRDRPAQRPAAPAVTPAAGIRADAERAALVAFIRALARDAARADHAETPQDE
ncbi:hypothetical protein OCH239_15580 [Roseivivax halodurans JCM 10272]|uniref:Uncharacterized protein n=1 Tax=Roseivivax halodurans JCM 10272 TaxID=1449350 RepID=X7EAM0_9RHOB|nr:hypothetical protein OCH239_15580 [Roseivivax halodurans JCM 10272]